MRLIDADALKESIKKKCGVCFDGTYDNRKICELIDNAPSVDAISNEEGYEMYGKGYLQGYERGKSERRRGE